MPKVKRDGYSSSDGSVKEGWYSRDTNNSSSSYQRKSAGPMRCFSCNGFGHRAFECPGGSGGGGGGVAGGYRNGGGGGFGGGRTRGCFNCGEEGHQSRECPNPRQERGSGGGGGVGGGRGCYNCGEDGHRLSACPTYNSNSSQLSNVSCFKCGQPGHMSWNCDVIEAGGRNQKACYKCRETGHLAASCPNGDGDKFMSKRDGSNICYKCGSTEHKLFDCPKYDSAASEDLPFAKCYVCSKEGHMARNCTENKKGMFPNGGACHGCGSTSHFVKDCPEKDGGSAAKDGEATGNSADEDMDDSSVKDNGKKAVNY